MPRVKHMRVIALTVALVFLFSSVAFAAVPQYVYFKSGSDMVKVDYAKAVNDAMNNNNTLYNAVKQYVGAAEETGAPVIVETDDKKVLDYQKALGAGKRFADIVNDPAYQATKPDVQKELRVENGKAVIGDIRPEVVEISSINQTDTLGVVEIVAAGTTAQALQAAITPACTVVAKEGVPNTYTVTIKNAGYDQEITLQFAAGFQLKAGVNNKVKWASPKLEVVSVSVINATTIAATMAEGVDATRAADKANYTVTVAGEAVDVSNVSYDPNTKVATLTVDLSGKEGELKVNGTAASAAVDYKAPTITSVTAINSRQIEVTFSEKVDYATDPANYSLYSAAGPSLSTLQSGTPTSANQIQASIIDVTPAGSNNTKVRITILAVGAGTTGYIGNTLSTGQYVLYANDSALTAGTSIADKAGNFLVRNTTASFNGVLTADSQGPVVQSAQYDNGAMELTLTFDEPATVVDKTKISIINGGSTVALAASNAVTGDGTTSLVFALTSDQNAAIGTLGSAATVQIAAGAVKDALDNNNTLASISLTALVRPVLTSATYDENTNKITLGFNKPVKLSTFNRSGFSFWYVTAGGATNLNVDPTNLVVETTGATADTVVLAPNQAGILQINAQRANASVTGYQVRMADNAVEDASSVKCKAPGGFQTLTMAYTKETTAPVVSGVQYTTANNTLAITFSERMRTDSLDKSKIYVQTKNDSGELVQIDAKLDGMNGTTNWSNDGKTLCIVLQDDEAAAMEATTITRGRFLVINAGHNLMDVNRNALADLDTKDKAVAVTYTITEPAGTITAEDHGVNLVYVTYANNLPSADSANKANFSIYETGNVNNTKTIDDA